MRPQAFAPRRALIGLAATAAVGAALAIPATGVAGVAAVQDDVLTTAPLAEIPARVEAVKQTRAKVTRIDVLWSAVAPTRPANPTDPNDPAYDWTRLDEIFTGLTVARITPIVSVYSTPDWAVQGRNTGYKTAYNPNAPVPALYGQFMRALATRYSGRFVPTGGVALLPRVRHFEVWNEPNLKAFFRFNSGTNVAKYKGLVRAAYPQIKKANARAIVIAGVGGPRSSSGGGNLGAKPWMQALVKDKSLKFDAYSQHIYPSRGPKFSTKSYLKAFPTWSSLQEIYDTLDTKRKGMKLYVTEAGYTTARTSFRPDLKPSGLAQQRLFLRQIFSLPLVKSPRMAAVVWFNLEDNRDWPAGLLRAGGAPKPSYAAFRAIAGRPIHPALRAELSTR
ncbi:GH39 family glycosyl hydrolase [Miltoncostaea oceani]|uniref:GH39 family glycosyl hydrolase n=1 Tax=Miltoncostaea oceani TaxID=2843216 RepID=UPI001C3E0F41|nr:hypothetical protein [Miltoncostaea oceani]